MKKQLKPLALSLGLLGLISAPVYAAATSDQSTEMQQFEKKMMERTETLEKEVSGLQHKVVTLTKELKVAKREHKHARHQAAIGSVGTTRTVVDQISAQHPARPGIEEGFLEESSSRMEKEGEINNAGGNPNPELGMDPDEVGSSLVGIGPYTGARASFTGNDLIINNPSINQDLTILDLRKKINKQLRERGISQSHPHMIISGELEGQLSYVKHSAGGASSDLDVTDAELDTMLAVNPWITGFMTFNLDNEDRTISNSRINNSRVFMDKAFVTIGNFDRSPVYGSFGQMFMPFGTYASSMVSASLPRDLARTRQRGVLLGYAEQSENAVFGQVYAFKGDSNGGVSTQINNGGVNLGYKMSQGDNGYKGSVGYIRNLADSLGLQGSFGSRSSTIPATENLAHTVGAADINLRASLGKKYDVIFEFISATQRFSPMDLSYNGHGASPKAGHIEGIYSFEAFDKPNSVALGYDQTWDAMGVQLPEHRYSGTYNISLWRDTLESLEFRHDVYYGSGKTATISHNSSGVATPVTPSGQGHADNSLIAQFDMYF